MKKILILLLISFISFIKPAGISDKHVETKKSTERSELSDEEIKELNALVLKDYSNKCFLSDAIHSGRIDIIERYLKLGGDVNSRSNDDFLIILAIKFATKKNFDLINPIVELLIDSGANLNCRESTYGRTPLLYAASKDNFAIVVKILEKDPSTIFFKDNASNTAADLTDDNNIKEFLNDIEKAQNLTCSH